MNGAAEQLGINKDMLKRALNVGFLRRREERMEILQMALLQPKMCILDETIPASTSTRCASSPRA